MIKNKNGYVLPVVILILTIITSTITVSVLKQNKNINLIENYHNKNTIEEEISAIELVILEYLNVLQRKTRDLSKIVDFQKEYKTPSEGLISVKLKVSDNCLNINSLVYKDGSEQLKVNDFEYKRFREIFIKQKINVRILDLILDWLDTDKINIEGKNEEIIYLENNLRWKPRNNLAIIIDELFMIPGYESYSDKLNRILCVNIFSKKVNIKKLSPEKLTLFLPFLDFNQSKMLLSIINNKIWLNSDKKSETINNIKNLKKEVEYVLGRPITSYEEKFFSNVGFKSNSVFAEITYKNKLDKIFVSFSKYEINQDKEVKIIYRLGPFLQNTI